ncbi:uncharacterized protein [Chironomus tepperi]|uniref:uncharacterized protein n=1 Tax=Chironomus tepperi TaxID=113505 RepID=UPI00391F17DE
MKVIAFGLLAFAAIAQSSYVPLVKTVVPYTSTTLVRTPSLDSAVINSERLDSSFRYNTVENHAYTPYINTPVVYQTVPQWNVAGQYPVVYSHYPSQPVYPFYNIVPSYNPVAPSVPAFQPGQTPIEVEDPADNATNDLKEDPNHESVDDDDTVEVKSA